MENMPTSDDMCLSPFGLLSQNTTDQLACKQPKFISHVSIDWQIQDQATSMVVFWSGLYSWRMCLHMVEGARDLL